MNIPSPHEGLVYTEFLPSLIIKREVQTYLEIGVHKGFCLAGVSVQHAIGVDPNFELQVDPTRNKKHLELHKMTSDRFFRELSKSPAKQFEVDLAFLDGMHLFEYLLRDIYNVERFCSKAAMIVLHDALPFDEHMISRTDTGVAWTGDVWKVIPILERYRPDLQISLIDCAPTGLVCLTNLDSSSTVLASNYHKIVREFSEMPNDLATLNDFYEGRNIMSAKSVLSGFDHTLYFRV